MPNNKQTNGLNYQQKWTNGLAQLWQFYNSMCASNSLNNCQSFCLRYIVNKNALLQTVFFGDFAHWAVPTG